MRRSSRPIVGRSSQSPKWAKAVKCSWCGAGVGDDCRDMVNNTSISRSECHVARLALAEREGRRPKRRRFAPLIISLIMLGACSDGNVGLRELRKGWCGGHLCHEHEHCIEAFGETTCLRKCSEDCLCCAVGHSGEVWCLESTSICIRAEEEGLIYAPQ